jgi:hypothetical protein
MPILCQTTFVYLNKLLVKYNLENIVHLIHINKWIIYQKVRRDSGFKQNRKLCRWRTMNVVQSQGFLYNIG